MTEHQIAPVVKTRTVPIGPERAFELFTVRAGDWWPVATHSIAGDGVAALRFEPAVGGRFSEVTEDGDEHVWGEILTWDPPHGFSMTWHPAIDPVASSTLEVRFTPTDGGTEVVLVHGGWEAFGETGAARRHDYDAGWDVVLGHFEASAGPVTG